MSILAASEEAGMAFLAVLCVLTAIGVTVAVTYQVFNARTVVGPQRLPERGGVAPLLLVLFTSLCLWFFLQRVYLDKRVAVWKQQGHTDVSHQIESLLSPQDMAYMSTVPPLAAFFAMVGMWLFMDPAWLAGLGLRIRQIGRGVLSGLLSFLVTGPAVFWTLIVTGVIYQRLHYQHPSEHAILHSMGQTDLSRRLVLAFGAAICAPLFEEFFFRGHIQTLIRHFFTKMAGGRVVTLPPIPLPEPPPGQPLDYQRAPVSKIIYEAAPWHAWMAIILTSMVFATFHPMWMWPPIFVLSLGLGYIYERTGNLWAPITVHCLFNSVETVQYLLLMRGH